MDALDHLNAVLIGKWLAFSPADGGDLEPRSIVRIVDGDADDAVVLVGTSDRADGTNLERLDLTSYTLWDDEPDCLAWCDEQNTVADLAESKEEAAAADEVQS
ncbi:hypothetical protein [Hyphomicrobium sp. 802]|uniref:hypothetical protein n=1 Tax=Hyphomicrobium sp. 802 TaxID=1112272 RepID=UPI00045E58F6|nr:hypothetical protein [Hyphomicrobium sp. 802]